VPSRRKLEGLKLLQPQPQPSKSTERVRAKHTRIKSEDRLTTRIEKRLPKKFSEKLEIPAENPEIDRKEPSENTVWIEENSIGKTCKKPEDFLPLRKLGRGSFGDVYLVKEVATNRLFAMKTLSKRRTEDSSWLRYVITERDVLAASDCPFIVKLHYAF
jgi:hypothetical protein